MLTDTKSVRQIVENKKRFLELLLLGDEQESMIDRYLDRGEMFVILDLPSSSPVGVAVVTEESAGVCELKNMAIDPSFQRQGLGTLMLNYLCRHYKGRYDEMILGTGDTPRTTSFYSGCGFSYSHTVENFFTDNYDHEIMDDGVLLKDMIYFRRRL